MSSIFLRIFLPKCVLILDGPRKTNTKIGTSQFVIVMLVFTTTTTTTTTATSPIRIYLRRPLVFNSSTTSHVNPSDRHMSG